MTELIARLTGWREDAGIAERVADFGSRLRARTWDHMAREIAALGAER